MVNWNSDKDSTILKGIFAFHNIKISQAFLKYLADEIGEGCTPKAVSHRLTNLRKIGKPVSSVSQTTSRATPSKSAGRAPRTPMSAKSVAAKKFDKDDSTDEGEPPISPSMARKRGRATERKSYAESDAGSDECSEEDFVPIMKKMKKQVKVEKDDGTGTLDKDDETDDFV